MWDERYSAQEYAYGTNPNEFLEANVSSIPKGKVLSVAEGEGRNAVFLAKQGYSLTLPGVNARGFLDQSVNLPVDVTTNE
jgi:Tellurite resistance protein TehB.